MLERWEAEEIRDVARTGRNRPPTFLCTKVHTPKIIIPGASPPSGPRITQEFVVKGKGGELDARSLCCEAFGYLLARELGILTPTPAVVNVDPTLLLRPDIAEVLRREQVKLQPGEAFGSEYFHANFTPVSAFAPLTNETFPQAVAIFAWDLVFQNPDRKGHNPNCAFSGQRLLAYDFELAFTFLLPLLGQRMDPWEVTKQGIHQHHVFYRHLRSREKAVDWEPFLTKLGQLTEGRMKALVGCMPVGWQPWAIKVCQHICTVQAHLDQLRWELRRSIK
ncbi:MAG: HipA family kinase [Armatimonadota bacterium]